jgi:hypothetical protein
MLRWIPFPAVAVWNLYPLPSAYRLGVFLSSYRLVRQVLADKIRTSEYLCFAIGGLVGDWASVAALEAIRQKKPFFCLDRPV